MADTQTHSYRENAIPEQDTPVGAGDGYGSYVLVRLRAFDPKAGTPASFTDRRTGFRTQAQGVGRPGKWHRLDIPDDLVKRRQVIEGIEHLKSMRSNGDTDEAALLRGLELPPLLDIVHSRAEADELERREALRAQRRLPERQATGTSADPLPFSSATARGQKRPRRLLGAQPGKGVTNVFAGGAEGEDDSGESKAASPEASPVTPPSPRPAPRAPLAQGRNEDDGEDAALEALGGGDASPMGAETSEGSAPEPERAGGKKRR